MYNSFQHSEAWLEKRLNEKAKRNGWLSFKFVSPAHRGVPDRILINPQGHVVFVELKNPNGKGALSPLQAVTIQKLLAQGADVRVVQSEDEVNGIFA